jgi:hypothetical protein
MEVPILATDEISDAGADARRYSTLSPHRISVYGSARVSPNCSRAFATLCPFLHVRVIMLHVIPLRILAQHQTHSLYVINSGISQGLTFDTLCPFLYVCVIMSLHVTYYPSAYPSACLPPSVSARSSFPDFVLLVPRIPNQSLVISLGNV